VNAAAAGAAAARPGRPDISTPALAYALTVAGLGLAAAAWVVAAAGVIPSREFLILACLAGLLGSRTVRLWSKVELSVALPFICAALMREGLGEAVVVSAAAAMGASLLRTDRLDAVRVAFNTAVISSTTAASGLVYLAAGGEVGGVTIAQSLVPLTVAVLVYFLLNSALVSGVIHLHQRVPVLKVWSENFVWSAPSYFTGSFVGLMIAILLERVGLLTFLLALPPSALIYYFYRIYLDRMEMQRRHLEEVSAMNRDLEAKVAERTEELVSVNRRLEESNRELTKASRMKSEFLANVSHELRTPLNAIIGFSELLLDLRHPAGEEERRQYLEDILASGRHLLEIINDILDLSKIEAGKMTLHLEEFPVEEVVEEALAMVTPVARMKGIQIGPRCDGGLPAVLADAAKVKQILYNLLSNAVKFTPEGGRVEVAAAVNGRSVALTVSDTGIGIALEDQERIFSEFLQLDGSYARRYQGTGLGLALVKRFVEMHGGRIWVESRPGSGSRFSFTIPLPGAAPAGGSAEGDEESAAPGGGAPAGSSSGAFRRPRPARTILIVEDNPLNLKLARDVLRRRGHNVIEAVSGQEALRKVRESAVDLILMDLQLPDMDGLEATWRLKADPATRDIPTIALTAHAMKGDDERARQAGCCGYIAKPIDTARFPSQVEAFLRS
jgi:signal transduction histidine kinase